MTDNIPNQKAIPGAPPRLTPTKSHKKKRSKPKSKPGDPNAPPSLPTSPVAADSELPDSRAQDLPVSEEENKPTPMLDLLNKRLKASNKKIIRITGYASLDADKLNDDQKRLIASLPSLESIHKELAELKKLLETAETDYIHELKLKQAESERAALGRLTDAVANNQRSNQNTTSNVLTLLRLRSLLSSAHSDALALNLDETEGNTIFALAEVLLGDESDAKEAVLSGLFTGQGEFGGVTYARLLEVVHTFLNPHPVSQSGEDDTKDALNESTSLTQDDEHPHPPSAGLNFTTASEIDRHPSGAPVLEDSGEWDRVEVMAQVGEPVATDLEESMVDVTINGHVAPSQAETALDWAAEDEGGLPPIAGLQASFGNSGSLTPVETGGTPDAAATTADVDVEAPTSHENGEGGEVAPLAPRDEDGFQEAGRGGRSRGRGPFRGGDRSHRGFRGGFRGERGARGFRGGERGFRGGERGFRGRSSGEWRNDGERGRSRSYGGRGRGGIAGGPSGPSGGASTPAETS